MKRIILLISALLLCVVLASCDSTQSEPDNTTTPLSSNVEEVPNTDDPSNTTEAPQPTETPFYSETDAPTPTETEADTDSRLWAYIQLAENEKRQCDVKEVSMPLTADVRRMILFLMKIQYLYSTGTKKTDIIESEIIEILDKIRAKYCFHS